MIHTVLRNLVSNAIKFTNTGGFVQILACKLADGIEISVKDSGVGMTGDTLKSLFHIDSSVTTNGTAGEKGSGLGLIICMEFIEKHGSHIHVESEPERGSKFSFSLPMA
jgi:signal transduction histidine kinase